MASLIAKNLTFSYSNNVEPVLKNVTVEIRPGTLTALVGPNGAGKSTLLSLLQGQNKPDHGEILVDGNSLMRSRSKVALMPQRSSMNWKFPITVEKLVLLGLITLKKGFLPYFFPIKKAEISPIATIDIKYIKAL